jgi:hypothetical protein
MNLQEPLKFSSVNFDKIVYPKQRTNNNKKIILIKLNEKNKLKNLVFQTPTLLSIGTPIECEGYSEMEIALEGKEKSKISKFINFLNDFEDKVKQDAMDNAYSWFNTSENTSINFQKITRDSENHMNGTLKFKLIKNSDFETIIQLNNNKRINVNSIPSDSWCKMILEAYAIWVNTNNDFGIFFRPILVSFTPKEPEIYNYKFIEDSDEDGDFDIPDTDIKPSKDNIFMNIQPSIVSNNNDSTSQLDINMLIQNLNTESNVTSETFSTEKSDSILKKSKSQESISSDTNEDSNTNEDSETNVVKIDLSDANLSDSSDNTSES